MPNPLDPQDLNRFSYVRNNPLRYVDPTGHRPIEEQGGKRGCSDPKYCRGGRPKPFEELRPKPGGGGRGNNNNGGSNDPNPGRGDILNNNSGNNGSDASEDIVDTLYQLANFSQDMATLTDMFGAAMVLGITGAECAVGLTVGGIPGMAVGCVAGGVEGIVAYNLSGINAIETGFSLASLVLTLAADGLDDGQLGEASYTSVTTFVAGLVTVDPFTDLIIDGYASGYNHGYFNDLHTILNGGPLLIP